MKKIIFIYLFCCVSSSAFSAETDTINVMRSIPSGGGLVYVEVIDGERVFSATLRDLWVFPTSLLYNNKKEEQFFWRTVRDVKRTLPYARLVSSELIMVNQKLAELPNDRERKKFINKYEKEIFAKYEKDLRQMTVNQGKMLIKLIDRECDKTPYDIVKIYEGGFVAFFWQGIAKLFGSNLKSEYDAKDKDKVVERIILLVESGQL